MLCQLIYAIRGVLKVDIGETLSLTPGINWTLCSLDCDQWASSLAKKWSIFRMYQDKLAQLKKQLQQLQEGTLPEYLKRLKRIEHQYKERLKLNETWQAYCVSTVRPSI